MKTVRRERVVMGTLEEVWTAWTTSEGARKFFAPEAQVELRLGGPYELFFKSSEPEGGKILSFLPLDMLSFEWGKTWVVVQLQPIDAGIVVRITHLGDFEENLRHRFEAFWEGVLDRLDQRFDEGPIDWSRL